MQSRRHSLYETFTGTFTGFIGSWLITFSVTRWGHFSPSTAATVIVALCTIWSLVRGYFNRRLWNR